MSEHAHEHKIDLTVVVNGQPVEMDHLNTNTILKVVVERALRESGNSGQPIDNWELRDAAGQILDLSKRIADYGIMDHARLFLSLKAGVGG
ncbi:MAG: DUF2604 domain-containing protein [Steroidobacteraceae bacterium]